MTKTTAIAFASLLLASVANAEYVADADPVTSGNQPGSIYSPLTLSGTTKSEGWTKLTAANYPGNGSYPGNSAWVGALGSQVGPNAGANGLAKVSNGTSGGPYPTSASIYHGGYGTTANTFGGTLSVPVSGSGLLSGVKTVIFQLDIGEAWTYDLFDDVAPVLTYTTSSGTYTISATYASRYVKYPNGQVYMNGTWEDLYINSRAYQFNLSGVTETILSYSVSFSGVEHSQVYGLGLQQSTATLTTNILPTNIP
ncbi:hypothetical protein KBB96_10695 [Luteolibacter ambystomatis]|uniref:PEP-CTERM sorting domain-containing protein n=1 Tax=Luteolibacter ambystomatis TaxID=2824561 RepID=A0A975G4T3_9BACT|nr:hypothetical protein [Luteolibacter ambystomatis]QUE49339.1 hypothetical protein KBB96_10695 [Luteolibacter ambystomatis]